MPRIGEGLARVSVASSSVIDPRGGATSGNRTSRSQGEPLSPVRLRGPAMRPATTSRCSNFGGLDATASHLAKSCPGPQTPAWGLGSPADRPRLSVHGNLPALVLSDPQILYEGRNRYGPYYQQRDGRR